jgi:serine protease Do
MSKPNGMTKHDTHDSCHSVPAGGYLHRLFPLVVGGGCAALSGALLWLAPLALQAEDQGSPKPLEKSEPESRNAAALDRPSGPALPAGRVSAPRNPSNASLDLPAVFRKQSPESLDDLKAIERQVQAILPGLSRAVVAVEMGGTTGSGVVVSEDGLVLTAAHVCDRPNRDVKFIFPDGKTAPGKTLGTDHEEDAGMMKISDPGPWPFAELGTIAEMRLGDWVLTLGHPGGYDPDRSMVVRLGRIIRLSPVLMQTDCTLNAGDSGGPLFDMRGRVIGIHSRISDSTAENFHVSIRAFRDAWDRLAKGESWGDERQQRPWFGARGVDHPDGCKLESVVEDAPAFKAGLKVGDVVSKINGQDVRNYATLRRLVAESKPGDELKIELLRDEKKMSFTVKIEARRWRR